MMSLLRSPRHNVLKEILLWICLLIPASAFLYSTNAHVRAIEDEMSATASSIAAEKESLRVLSAEWAYLNSPQRLAEESKRFLTNSTTASAMQVVALRALPNKLNPRNESVASNNIAAPNPSATTSPMLASPISFNPASDNSARLPSSASWSHKYAASPLQNSAQRTP